MSFRKSYIHLTYFDIYLSATTSFLDCRGKTLPQDFTSPIKHGNYFDLISILMHIYDKRLNIFRNHTNRPRCTTKGFWLLPSDQSVYNINSQFLSRNTKYAHKLKKKQCFTGNVQCSPISIFAPDLLSYVYIFIPVTNCFHVIRVAFSFNEWQVLYSIDFSNLLLSYFQPQNEHIELHRKRHGYRLDYHERKSVKPRYCECFWGLTWPILIV